MWVIFGTNAKTELVRGGAREEGECQSCGERVVFYERRVVKTFDLYFVDLFEYGARRVMACDACGTLYAVDGVPEGRAKVASSLERAVDGAGAGIERALRRAADAVEPMLDEAGRAIGPRAAATTARLGDALERIGGRVRGTLDRGASRVVAEQNDDDDALDADPEKADLLRRFAELEKRMKK